MPERKEMSKAECHGWIVEEVMYEAQRLPYCISVSSKRLDH